MMQTVRDIPRWFLLGVLVYAPWAYGSTRAWSLDLLKVLLLVLSALFVLSLLISRRRPQIPWVVLGLCGGLLALGWWMTLNARAVFDPVGPQFQPVSALVSWLPGTLDQQRSLSTMLLVTGMLGAFLTAADMLGHARWRERLWLAVALIGSSVILFGVIQRLSGANAIFWVWGDGTGKTFFATYRYHANAGAFINLVIPFIMARALWVLRHDASQASKAFWCVASFIGVAAAFLNISRAAMAITLLIVILFGLWWMLAERRESYRPSGSPWWLKVTGAVVAIAVLAYAFGLDNSVRKWLNPSRNNDLGGNLRYQVYDIIEQQTFAFVGWEGSGPGTFEMVFPLSVQVSGNAEVARWYWINAHEDYLQTLVDWGWAGSLLWGVLIPGGLIVGGWRLLRHGGQFRSETRHLLLAGCVALLGVLLHALVDFPLQIGSLQLYAAMSCAVVWMVGGEEKDGTVRRKRRKSPTPKH